MQDNNLPSAGAAGAIVLLAQKLKAATETVKTAVQAVISDDKHINIERTGNSVSISLVDVASKSETDTKISALEQQDEAHTEKIGELEAKDAEYARKMDELAQKDTEQDDKLDKLITFTGYEEGLDLVAKVNEVLE